MKMVLKLLGILFWVTQGVHAYGQVVIEMEREMFKKKSSEKGLMLMYYDKNKFRMDLQTLEGKTLHRVIIRNDKKLMWTIDEKKKMCMETSLDMKPLQQKLDKQMERLSKSMPAELQAQFRAEMDKMKNVQNEAADPIEKITFQKQSTGNKVRQWVCDSYDGYEHSKNSVGQKVLHMCVTPWSQLGVSKEALSIGLDNAQMQTSAPEMGFLTMFDSRGMKSNPHPSDNGYPVQSIHYVGTQISMKTELRKVEARTLSPETFEIPKGYKKRTLDDLFK